MAGKKLVAVACAEGAELAALVGGAEGLRGIVEHEQVMRLGRGRNGVVIGRQAEQIDRDHRLRLEPEPAGGRDGLTDALGVDVEGVGLNVDEDRRRADQHRHFRRRAEGERGADHRVARADALGAQRQHQRIGAAGATDGMARAAECGELGLERAHFGTEHELTMREHARDRRIDRGAQPAPLGRDVDEGNGRQTLRNADS